MWQHKLIAKITFVSFTQAPETGSETPAQRFRVPLAAWMAFGDICDRRGIRRAQRLFELMRNDARRYGTDEERAVFTAADQEMRQRRSRKPRG